MLYKTKREISFSEKWREETVGRSAQSTDTEFFIDLETNGLAVAEGNIGEVKDVV